MMLAGTRIAETHTNGFAFVRHSGDNGNPGRDESRPYKTWTPASAGVTIFLLLSQDVDFRIRERRH
jgi:hypothetical protein